MAKITHRLTYHRHYPKWNHMMQRCYNIKCAIYPWYGAKGIMVSDEFKDCKTFLLYLDSLPGYDDISRKSLDRIENKGNYERGNLRWATQSEQLFNRSEFKVKASTFRNVSFSKRTGLWRAYIYTNRIMKHIGFAETQKDAAILRDRYIIENKLNRATSILNKNL